MARYLTSSKKQREREQEETERKRQRAAERSQRVSRGKDMDLLRQVTASQHASTSTSDNDRGSPDQVDTRRRRNPDREKHRTENMIHHQMHAAEVYVDRFYVIQKLLNKRLDAKGNEEYLVRWQNYPPNYDSWEPRAELEKNAMDMINEYNCVPKPDDCSSEKLHCICRLPYTFEQGGMIQCLNCEGWYHFTCLKMNMVEANSYAKYYCDSCRKKDPRFKNVIKKEKMSTILGNTTIAKIESNSGVVLQQ